MHHRHRVGRLYALAVHHGVIRLYHTLPAVVTVHGIIAAAYRRYLPQPDPGQLILQLLYILRPGGRRYVTPVHEAVDKHLFHAVLFGHLQKPEQVPDMAMHAAVG